MIKKKGSAILLLLLALSILQAPAQTNTPEPPTVMESNVPQWVKDLRRWEIVAFGSFPFTLLTATIGMDMRRWSQANGMSMSSEGRRYAPWPLKSAGAIAMDKREQGITISIAAGLSIAIAVADLIIVQVKRSNARKRAEALPVGTTIITRTPRDEEPDEQEGNIVSDDEIVSDEVFPETP